MRLEGRPFRPISDPATPLLPLPLDPARRRPPDRRVIHPLWHTLGIGLLALAVSGLGLPEAAGAVAVMAGVTAVAWLHPLNGVSLLFLVVPFFLGESGKSPAFLLLPAAVLVVIGFGLRERLRSEQRWIWPHPGPLSFYLAAAVLALPLDLKELREDLWVHAPSDLVGLVLRGVPAVSPLYSLQVILLALLGAGLYVVIVNLRPSPELIRRTVLAAAPIYGGLAILGVLKLAGAIPYEGRYLSLSFYLYATVGDHPHRLTAVAWNPDYYAQYLVFGAPWFAVLLGSPAWRERLGALALVPGAVALALTFQRGAYLSFLAVLGLMTAYGVLAGRAGGRRGLWGSPWVWVGGLGVLSLAVLTLDLTALGGAILARVRAIWELGDPNRLHLWRVALAMFSDQPLLGVGTGRFAFFFSQYSSLAPREFGPFWGTAHSLYLQILAEQGIVGLLALGLWIGALLRDGLRGLGREPSPASLLLAAGVISLGGWLAYGVFQHTLYIWGLFFYFWLLAAFITSLGAGPLAGAAGAPRRPLTIALVLCLVVAGGWRVGAVAARPGAIGYEAGFFRWERQADQTPARWTARRAALVLPAAGSTLVLTVSAPLPGIARRPQLLRVWLDAGPPVAVAVPGPEWVQLRLPVDRPPGHPLRVRLETAYTVNPKQVGVSADDRTLGVLTKPLRWE